MKVFSLFVFALAVQGAFAQADRPARLGGNDSFKHEVERAMDRGIDWLRKNQDTNGFWSTADHPAITALALLAVKGRATSQDSEPDWVRRGYDFIRKCSKPDGGIYEKGLVTYNTSLALLALAGQGKEQDKDTMRKARRFLVGLQRDFGEKGKLDDPMDGGIGYGSKYEHSDMGNTAQALEALYYTKHLLRDQKTKEPDLNWDAAIRFLENCQNLPGRNQQAWVSDDPKHKGGFIYYPGHSMAGAETNANGRVALRSYGSISYAGLLSYVYAELKPDDPRVKAVHEWLQKNFTLEENPGMGPQGLYYYFHTMAKGLTILNVRDFKTATGQTIDWRKELATRLLNLQARDGSWANENARWWEKDPALVTSYAVLTLGMIHRGM